jgi:chromosome segregation protein
LLFGGGQAKLSLLYEQLENIEGEEGTSQNVQVGKKNISGIDIKATPPGKKLALVQSLSGGERALTSIALLCAMIACFPAPIVVLDEADAALDEANTVRFGQILASLSSKTQFITVTHNRETMAKADVLYGVTMGQDGVSKVLSIKMDQAAVYAK